MAIDLYLEESKDITVTADINLTCLQRSYKFLLNRLLFLNFLTTTFTLAQRFP